MKAEQQAAIAAAEAKTVPPKQQAGAKQAEPKPQPQPANESSFAKISVADAFAQAQAAKGTAPAASVEDIPEVDLPGGNTQQ